MSYLQDYRRLLAQIEHAGPLPDIAEVLLPAARPAPEKKDEFGFVLLSDGCVGPFYTSLADTLIELQHDFSGRAKRRMDTLATAGRLGTGKLHASALALGAFNALSQHLMRRAGFDPTAHSVANAPEGARSHIGMVGFFPPLADKYLQLGCRITVIEKQPERVPAELELQVFTTPEALADCDYVVCTASTLINNTIDEVLRAVPRSTSVNLFGPSASGLPDLLFSRGVTSVGGIVIERVEQLRTALASGETWGKSGHKYQLAASSYPGVSKLLEQSK